MQPLFVAHVQQAGMAGNGPVRTLLEFSHGDTTRYADSIAQALAHLEGSKRRSANPVAELAQAVCYVAQFPDADAATNAEFRRDISQTALPTLARDSSNNVVTPTKLTVSATLPECADEPDILLTVKTLNAQYADNGILAGAKAIWTFMTGRHAYLDLDGALDTQLLLIHALQNATAVVRPALFEAMLMSVSPDAASADRKWLPGHDAIDAYLLQECPESLATSSAARKAAGMLSPFSETCIVSHSLHDPTSVPVTFSESANTILTITEEVWGELRFLSENTGWQQRFQAIKVRRSVATLHVIENGGETYAIALCNWHASNKGADYPAAYAEAVAMLHTAMQTVAERIEPDAQVLCIVAGDSNLSNAKDSAAAVDHLHTHGLEMFNSANSDGSSKCCQVTVRRGARTTPMTTQWNARKLQPTIAMKDVLVVPIDKGGLEIGATVFSPGEETPRNGFLLDHAGWGFTVYKRSADDCNTVQSAVQPALKPPARKSTRVVLARAFKLFFVAWTLALAYEVLKEYT